MNDPIVSVIIPTYNRAHMVSDAIDSVLAQNVEGLEVVVVDDGSSDNTQEVLARYADKIVSVHQPNAGCTGAKNRGVEVSRGSLLTFLGDDDIMLPDSLAPRVKFMMDHPEVGAVSGNLIFSGRESANYLESCGIDFAKQAWVTLNRPFQKLLDRNFVVDGACVFRRAVFEDVGGFDLSLLTSQDWDLYLRMARRWSLACMNLPCTLARLPGRNISGSEKELADTIRVIDKALRYGEPIAAAVRKRVLQMLYRYLKVYLVLEAEGKMPAHSRIEVMDYVASLPWHRRMAIGVVAAMPRGLLAFGLRQGRRLKRLFQGAGSPQG